MKSNDGHAEVFVGLAQKSRAKIVKFPALKNYVGETSVRDSWKFETKIYSECQSETRFSLVAFGRKIYN